MSTRAFKGCDVDVYGDLSAFADMGKVSNFAKEPMTWAVAEGLISGVAVGDREALLDPQGAATREQFAMMMADVHDAGAPADARRSRIAGCTGAYRRAPSAPVGAECLTRRSRALRPAEPSASACSPARSRLNRQKPERCIPRPDGYRARRKDGAGAASTPKPKTGHPRSGNAAPGCFGWRAHIFSRKLRKKCGNSCHTT